MKTITLALLLAFTVSLGAQTTDLTDAERAKVAPDMLAYLYAECIPIERTIIAHQEVVRFRCQSAVDRVFVFDGSVVTEPKGFAAFKTKVKTIALYTVAGIILAVVIYGKAQA